MRLYHRTPHPEAILRDGFRDATGTYLTSLLWTGVWFSDVPLDENEGAKGDGLLAVELDEGAIAEYEWAEEGKPYREWLIPAAIANAAGPPEVVTDEDEASRFMSWPRM